ncbi:MAG: hypothetical protein AAB805_00045 [Patescibacteria group bacterium]
MITRALREVFGNPAYMLLSGVVSFVAFSLAVWLPNARLLFTVAASEDASLFETLAFAFHLLLSITTNFTVLSATYTIAIALLIGANTACIIYVFRRQKSMVPKTGAVAGFFGVASGILGVGCTACGTLILTSALATFGGAGALAFLPLRGGEFGIAGVFLLFVSLFFLAKQITSPLLCYPTVIQNNNQTQ